MSWRFEPHPGKQQDFFTHPAREVGYGGSAGSGKSAAMLYHFCYLLDFEQQRYERGEISQSNVWIGYFRRVVPNLRQTIDIAKRTFPLIDAGVKWHETDHAFTFSCGLKYLFGAMEKPADYLKFYGWEFQEQNFDELTEFEEEQWDQLGTRLRTPDPALKRFMNRRWGSNPTGPGLIWVRRKFVDPYKDLQVPVGTTLRVQTKVKGGKIVTHDQVFIQAYLSDNPSLAADGDYEASLRRNKPHIYKALLDGNWYFTSGGLLSNYWREEHHVCNDHNPPPNTWRFRSCDWGLNTFTSVTWWYIDNDGAMTAYYHLYVKEKSPAQVAAMIREIERHFGDWDDEENRSLLRRSPLDAKCFHREQSMNPNVADEFRKNGVAWMPSIKDRFNGIAEVVRRLDYFIDLDTGKRINVEQIEGRKVKPMIRWMRRCAAPRRILPILPQDPHNPGDVPRDAEDHVLDDTMYGCASNPLKPQLRVVEDDDDDLLEERNYKRKWDNKRGMGRLIGMR